MPFSNKKLSQLVVFWTFFENLREFFDSPKKAGRNDKSSSQKLLVDKNN